ncbi:MAG: (deoxy)nucleoside triphosphate pyrophosphohydrolase [Chitinispirillaceae bacterium]
MSENQGGAPIKVSCAILERNGKILAARRGPGQSQAGLWEFPGGKLDEGESAQDALTRELQEELGITASITQSLTSVLYEYPAYRIELIPFICRILHGEPFPHEHSEIAWLHPADAGALDWAPADIPVVQEYLSLSSK